MSVESEEQPVEEPIHPDFQAPIRLLRDASAGLLDRRSPISKERVEGLYRHLAGAVGQILESARKQLNEGLDQFREANPEAVGEEFEQVLEIFREGQERIDDGMRLMAQTFFASTDLASLEANAGALSLAESHIQDGLDRMESALALTEDPTILGQPGPVTAAEVPTALDSLGSCLDQLTVYLEKGQREQLEEAMVHLDQARGLLLRALAQSEG